MFLNNYRWNFRRYIPRKSIGNKKNIITKGYTDEMKRVIYFLPTDLSTEKNYR